VVAFEHARVGLQRAYRALGLVMVGRRIADVDERRDGESGLGPIDPGRVSEDVATFLEALDPLHDGGSREADLIGEGLIAGAAVGRQELEEAAADGIDVGHADAPDSGSFKCMLAGRIVNMRMLSLTNSRHIELTHS